MLTNEPDPSQAKILVPPKSGIELEKAKDLRWMTSMLIQAAHTVARDHNICCECDRPGDGACCECRFYKAIDDAQEALDLKATQPDHRDARIAALEAALATAREQQEQLKKLGIEWRDGGRKWANLTNFNVTTFDPAAVLAAVAAAEGAGAV